ncbi:MAG: hypothetical protein IJ723_01290, partial [Ruminococcus sp.]|nr:hypothetical protein [Ruminococcus sp.]
VMTVSGTALPSAAEGVTAQTGDVQSAGRIIEGDKFLYRTEADGTATILDLTEKAVSSKGVVTIPDKLDGASVAGISVSTADLFRSHWDTVKRVDFPVTLTEIKDKGKVDRTEHTIGIGFKDERYIPAEFDAMSFQFVTYKPNQKTKIKCARG